jgi:isoleucyl-tRNA synthetase
MLGLTGQNKPLFELRERALPELERERQAKTIGKALDARIAFSGSADALADAETHRETLRELWNVSQLEVNRTSGSSTDSVQVTVSKARGEKCERCWHWEEDVGKDSKHPTLCLRCVEAVQAVSQGQERG